MQEQNDEKQSENEMVSSNCSFDTHSQTNNNNNQNSSPSQKLSLQLAKKEPFTLWTLQDIIKIERKPRQHRRITMDVSKCQYDVVKQVATDIFNWNIIAEQNPDNLKDFNVLWNDSYIQEEELRRLLPYQKINRFPGSFNMGRKNLLARNLTKMKKVHTNEYNYFPKTWLLPNQYEELRQFVARNNFSKILIVKPENQSQGKGIFLTKKVESVLEYGEHYVVQEYLMNPYLIDELKFDMRIYVLLKSVWPLKIFIYKEGLGRLATQKYEKPTKGNIGDVMMHLTNYAINKKSPNFIYNEKEVQDDVGHKRSLSSVFKQLQGEGQDVEKLWREIKKIVVSTLCSCAPYLQHVYRTCQPKEENSEMAFELFGFDVILDDTFKPWLLEVNHTPSFTTDTPLDHHIKNSLILDTLIMENVTWKQRKQYYEQKNMNNPSIKGTMSNKMSKEEIEALKQKVEKWEDNHMGGFERIYPTKDPELQTMYDSFLETAQSQWDEWSGAKILRVQKKEEKKVLPPQPKTRPAVKKLNSDSTIPEMIPNNQIYRVSNNNNTNTNPNNNNINNNTNAFSKKELSQQDPESVRIPFNIMKYQEMKLYKQKDITESLNQQKEQLQQLQQMIMNSSIQENIAQYQQIYKIKTAQDNYRYQIGDPELNAKQFQQSSLENQKMLSVQGDQYNPYHESYHQQTQPFMRSQMLAGTQQKDKYFAQLAKNFLKTPKIPPMEKTIQEQSSVFMSDAEKGQRKQIVEDIFNERVRQSRIVISEKLMKNSSADKIQSKDYQVQKLYQNNNNSNNNNIFNSSRGLPQQFQVASSGNKSPTRRSIPIKSFNFQQNLGLGAPRKE